MKNSVKIILILLILGGILYFFNKTKKNNRESKIETKHIPNKYLSTNNIKVELKKYPNLNSPTLLIITKNSSCIELEKGSIDTINNITDYWYKIKYNETIGWIFGSETSEKLENREFIVQKLPFEYKVYNLNKELIYYKKDWLERGGEIGLLSYDGIFPLGWNDNGDFCYIKIINDYLPSDVYLEIISLNGENKSYLINHFDFENSTIYPQISANQYYDFRRNHIKDAYNTTIKEKKDKIYRLLNENNIKISQNFTLTRTIVEKNKPYVVDLELIKYQQDEFENKVNIYLNKNGKRIIIKKDISCGYSDNIYCYFIDNPYSNIKVILYVNLESSLDEEHLRNKIMLVNIKK